MSHGDDEQAVSLRPLTLSSLVNVYSDGSQRGGDGQSRCAHGGKQATDETDNERPDEPEDYQRQCDAELEDKMPIGSAPGARNIAVEEQPRHTAADQPAHERQQHRL